MIEMFNEFGGAFLRLVANNIGFVFILFMTIMIGLLVADVVYRKNHRDKSENHRFEAIISAFFASATLIIAITTLAFEIHRNNTYDTKQTPIPDEQERLFENTPASEEIREKIDMVGVVHANGKKVVGNIAWESDRLLIEEGQSYELLLLIENSDLWSGDKTGRDVSASFALPAVVSAECRVDGYLDYPNISKDKYLDSVILESAEGRKFYLDYIEGTACLKSAADVEGEGIPLDDKIIDGDIMIRRDYLEKAAVTGQTNHYVSIQVKPVFEDSTIDASVRMKGESEWKSSVNAKVGDLVEYQVAYTNLNNTNVDNAIVRVSFPDNISYVKGSTRLFNTTFSEGASTTDDTICIDGINIGSYAVGGNAYVRFTGEVTDKNLSYNTNRLILWAKASANHFATQAHADVYVKK